MDEPVNPHPDTRPDPAPSGDAPTYRLEDGTPLWCPGCRRAHTWPVERCPCGVELNAETLQDIWWTDQQIQTLTARRTELVAGLRHLDLDQLAPPTPAAGPPAARDRQPHDARPTLGTARQSGISAPSAQMLLAGAGVALLVAAAIAVSALVWQHVGQAGRLAVLGIWDLAAAGVALTLAQRKLSTTATTVGYGHLAVHLAIIGAVAGTFSGVGYNVVWAAGLAVAAVTTLMLSRRDRLGGLEPVVGVLAVAALVETVVVVAVALVETAVVGRIERDITAPGTVAAVLTVLAVGIVVIGAAVRRLRTAAGRTVGAVAVVAVAVPTIAGIAVGPDPEVLVASSALTLTAGMLLAWAAYRMLPPALQVAAASIISSATIATVAWHPTHTVTSDIVWVALLIAAALGIAGSWASRHNTTWATGPAIATAAACVAPAGILANAVVGRLALQAPVLELAPLAQIVVAGGLAIATIHTVTRSRARTFTAATGIALAVVVALTPTLGLGIVSAALAAGLLVGRRPALATAGAGAAVWLSFVDGPDTLTVVGFLLVAAATERWSVHNSAAVMLVPVAASASVAAAVAGLSGLADPQAWMLPVIAAPALLVALHAARRTDDDRAWPATLSAQTVGSLLAASGSLSGAGHWAAATWFATAIVWSVWATRRPIYVWAAKTAGTAGWWTLLAAGTSLPVEVWTLPPAAVSLAWGWRQLTSGPTTSSWKALSAGLALALSPTIMLAGEEPARVLLLAAAGVVLLSVGIARRYAVPVLAGTLSTVIVLSHVVGVATSVPGWAWFATCGAVLLWLSITFEQQRQRAHALSEWAARLT